MRATPNLDVERFRVQQGPLASSRPDGNNGQFIVPFTPPTPLDSRIVLMCVVSDGADWEHVSVSVKVRMFSGQLRESERTPTWEEMCHVKDLFWDRDECVIQYHPRAAEYRNCHKYVLHLWRPTNAIIPEPNADFVGPRPNETEEAVRERWGASSRSLATTAVESQ